MPGLLEAAPRAMVELLEAAAPLLQATVGEDVQIICFQARVVPSGGGEYGGWHRDSGSPADNPTHPTLVESAKLFVPVFDHTAASGCTGVVPFTNRSAEAPPPECRAGPQGEAPMAIPLPISDPGSLSAVWTH